VITVEEIMSTELRTLTEEDSLADAMKLMSEHNFHHIPIVDGDNGIVGLVTHTDVLSASDSNLSGQSLDRNPAEIRIGEFMTRDVATVDARANLRQAALYLQKHDYGCLPVVTDGVLAGIVTDNDFIGVAINLLEQLEFTEPEEL
jgi:CBS domain-containing membrane protein